MHKCIHSYIHTYARTCINSYIDTYIHTYVPTYVHTSIDAYTFMYRICTKCLIEIFLSLAAKEDTQGKVYI